MNDTTAQARKKQLEIILSKTPEERFLLGCDMIDSTYFIVKNSIIQENPHYSEREIVAAIFERYYRNDFSREKLHEIMQAIRNYNPS
ncbi:MAG: hypothetical protein IPL46_16220 [Saprospiraceae bacterium]|nr:hypothetical protein [Saprospiraceae bacterium]